MEEDICENNHNIENIVISGGGPAGFAFYGAIKELCKKDIINPDKIKNIYATSAGTKFRYCLY